MFGVISHSPDVPALETTRRVCRPGSHGVSETERLWHNESLGIGCLGTADTLYNAQAAQSSCGGYVVCCCGDLYNHGVLRQELNALGCLFNGRSDAELLMHAYAAWGLDCLTRLQGAFAFAIVDNEKREILLCRDMFGMKPLFYRIEDKALLFSSQLPCLNLSELPSLTANPAAPALFFRYQYIPSPCTMYEKVWKLPAAHYMRVDFEGMVICREAYGNVSFRPEQRSHDETLRRADAIIGESVSLCARKDAGLFLSGGIDSTLVGAYAATRLGSTLPAFTIAFKDSPLSELEYAESAAARLGLKLHVKYVGEPDLDNLGDILSFYGEPFGDASVLPTWHVAGLAKEHCSLVLSGDGGDELFAGYNHYRTWMRELHSQHGTDLLASLLRFRFKDAKQHWRRLKARPGKTVRYRHTLVQAFSPKRLKALLRPPYNTFSRTMAPALEELVGREHLFADLDLTQYMDMLTYLPDNCNQKVNCASTLHGLPIRSPLLSSPVLKFALSLPPEQRCTPEAGGKAILKELLLRKGFEREFVFRRKQGFDLPLRDWFMKGRGARNLLEELLGQKGRELDRFIHPGAVRAMLKRHDERGNCAYDLWQIMAFAFWLDKAGPH